MKTLEQIIAQYQSRSIDGRDLSRLVDFLSIKQCTAMGIELKGDYLPTHVAKPFTRENILAQLKESDVPVRLPWRVICGLACYAMIHKMNFDQVAAMALRAEMQRRERK